MKCAVEVSGVWIGAEEKRMGVGAAQRVAGRDLADRVGEVERLTNSLHFIFFFYFFPQNIGCVIL